MKRNRSAFQRRFRFLAACGLLTLLACRGTPAPSAAGPDAPEPDYFRPFRKLWQEDELAQHPELSEASRYELRMEISESLTEIAGSLRVRFTNRQPEPLSELPFFCYPNLTPGALDVSRVTVFGFPVQAAWRDGGTLLAVPLAEPLQPQARTEIAIEYSLRVPDDPEEASAYSYAQGVLSLAHAYPMIPAPQTWGRAPPGRFGDFVTNEVSFYVVQVGAPEGVVLATPGIELARRSREGRIEVVFAVGPARELYLAASRDFIVLQEMRRGTVVRSVAPRGREQGAAVVLTAAHDALESFSRRFGPYPFTTLTVASAPLRSLGIEFPGIVVLASRLYDSQGQSDVLPQREVLEGTLAHEVAHQWFYASVGNDQLEQPWIDESLAQYAFWLYVRDRNDDAIGAFRELEEYWNGIGRASIPIGMPVSAYSHEEYTAIIYGRAPLFLHALSERMGEERFDLFLSELATRYEWQLIGGEEFHALAEELCRCQLDDLWAEWVGP